MSALPLLNQFFLGLSTAAIYVLVALGLTTIFYPMGRVERMEKDEDLGPVASYAARFEREVGRTVRAVVGIDSDED